LQGVKHALDILPVIGTQQAGDILHHGPFWLKLPNDSSRFIEQSTSRTVHSRSLPRDRQVLTGRAKTDDVHRREVMSANIAHVREQQIVRVVASEHPLAGRVDLDTPERLDPVALETESEPAYPGEKLPMGSHAATSISI
jgi:hypothetical protein